MLQVFEAANMVCERRFTYAGGKAVHVNNCRITAHPYRYLIFSFTTHFIGIWLPLATIVVVHLAMFFKLRKQARIRAHSSGVDTSRHMIGISRIFIMIVVTLFTCLLPWSVMNIINQGNTDSIYINDMKNFSIPLANMNSCLSPLIYSKIHRKFGSKIQRIFGRIIEKTRQCFLNSSTIEERSKNQQTVVSFVTSSENKDDVGGICEGTYENFHSIDDPDRNNYRREANDIVSFDTTHARETYL